MAAVPFRKSIDAAFEGEARLALESTSLPAFLLRQRWFAGKASPIKGVRFLDRSHGGGLPESHCLALVEVVYQSEATETYMIPLGLAQGLEAERIEREQPVRVIARLPKLGLIYDALADESVGELLLEAISGSRTIRADMGSIQALTTSALTSVRGSTKDRLPVKVGSFEQSNSAIIFGDRLILKIFRRLDLGINPDFEIGRFLSEKTSFDRIPKTAGAILYEIPGSEPMMLGILQGLVPNQGSGWDHALRELKNYYENVKPGEPESAEGRLLLDLARVDVPSEIQASIGPYLQDAATLGKRTAELHLALASAPDEPAFAPEPMTSQDLDHLANQVISQVEKTLDVLRSGLEKLPETLRSQAKLALEETPLLLDRVESLRDLSVEMTRTRVHGDYHLGQVLRAGQDFVILDFEGEPAKPLSERIQKVSPLKDVVGMIRSFDYAAFAGLFDFTKDRPELLERLIPHAKSWRTWVSASFLRSYLTTAQGVSFLPTDLAAIALLLDVLMLDKALYELLYELNNRPDWVRIPLQGIVALLPPPPSPVVSILGEMDLYLIGEGTHYRSYDKLGAHPGEHEGVAGCHFAVWAPNALRVSMIGEFNNWKPRVNRLQLRGTSGIWEGFVPGVQDGMAYKYSIESRYGDYKVAKADPYAFGTEPRPRTASVVRDLEAYHWDDAEWMSLRSRYNSLGSPLSIYEVHLGSWMRGPENRWLTYRELAPKLADYVHEMGFTHVELLPVAEHPFDGSWGYQVTGYYAPSSRFGSPLDFMAFVDLLHNRGIGVILDWVPAHFPTDEHALGYFDGTHLYEHNDPRQGFHPDWDTFIFNFGRPEVANFLVSNALFWLDKYHIDGLRVDAVASMIYRDYSRKPGEWVPNQFGGRENIEALQLIKRVNDQVHTLFPGVLTIAEESTSWPMVTRPTSVGGLGFDLKWDMGWMHDTLDYFQAESAGRVVNHNKLTFRGLYQFAESFVLALSHDEVVYGKGSLLNKMPGDAWKKFANVRLLFGYMFAQPGKKMIFMGDEFGQWAEWNHDRSLDWHLLGEPLNAGLKRWVRDLNTLYRGTPELHELDNSPKGFAWINPDDAKNSVLSLVRKGNSTSEMILFVANFTTIPLHNYRVGVPIEGRWTEILNSDAPLYGGSGQGNIGGATTTPVRMHGHEQSLNLTLPPLGIVALRSPSQYCK